MSWTPLGQVVYAFAPVAHLRASLQASIWTWAQVAISPGFNNQGRDLTTTPPSCLNYSYQTCQFRPQLSGNCTVAHAHLHLQALIVTSSQSPRVAIFVALVCFANVRRTQPLVPNWYHPTMATSPILEPNNGLLSLCVDVVSFS